MSTSKWSAVKHSTDAGPWQTPATNASLSQNCRDRTLNRQDSRNGRDTLEQPRLTVETSSAFTGLLARSTTGPCPIETRCYWSAAAFTGSKKVTLTPNVEDRLILARNNIRQRFTVCKLAGDIWILKELIGFVVLAALWGILNRELVPDP